MPDKIIEPMFGTHAGKLIALPLAEADQAIADDWARDRYAPDYPQYRNDWTTQEIADATQAAQRSTLKWAGVALLDSLDPDSAAVGAADLTMSAKGLNFTADTVIVFNGGAEVTDFVSDTELTTVVKPSTASGPATVPVQVRQGSITSAPLTFTFTEGQQTPAPAAIAGITNTDPARISFSATNFAKFADGQSTTLNGLTGDWAEFNGTSHTISDPDSGDHSFALDLDGTVATDPWPGGGTATVPT